VRDQLVDYCVKLELPLGNPKNDREAIRKCLLTGFFANVAELTPDGEYKTKADNKVVRIHPSSVLFQKKAPCVIYNEMVLVSRIHLSFTPLPLTFRARIGADIKGIHSQRVGN
jgi:hypothetical protein